MYQYITWRICCNFSRKTIKQTKTKISEILLLIALLLQTMRCISVASFTPFCMRSLSSGKTSLKKKKKERKKGNTAQMT